MSLCLFQVAAEDMHAAYATKPDADDGMSAKVKEQKTNSNFPVSTEEIMDTKLIFIIMTNFQKDRGKSTSFIPLQAVYE
ncbi:hypothetical protein T11_5118 [Trichinella zimbabwensis]|uniref:Uncharacterized protein n=1 Tax=Trichinella zimbabwensis TaxID=268475 RepID=A0A0V1I0T1_9BILA|nr:hypothetical protein T11_5118 [Trichinella zimbabwensis]